MSTAKSRAGRKVFGVAAGAVGLAVAGTAVTMAHRRRVIARRTAGDEVAFGSLRSHGITVVADDGLPLHAEIDDFDPDHARAGRLLARSAAEPPVNLVFVHGYALDHNCWHFQRAGYRGQIRSVFYDQRSHGRSARSAPSHATVDQLGRDLKRVLDDLTGDVPVVLVGHSMGGMTILALAAQHPELFGSKVRAVGLMATAAGGLDTGRILFPMLPRGIGHGVVNRTVRMLYRGHRAVDALRGANRDIALVITDAYSFGGEVPAGYLEFVFSMIAGTPFEVVADFYPSLAALDVSSACEIVSRVPTTIIAGTRDRVTPIELSRDLHALIAGSDLVECEQAGHMVLMECHELVHDELDKIIARAVDDVEADKTA